MPTVVEAQAMITALRPKIESIVDNLSDTTTTLRSEVQRVDATVNDAVDRARLQIIRADELLSRTLDRVEQTSDMVLYARRDYMIARRNPSGHGEIVALRTTAGEDDFRRAAPQQIGHGFARVLDRGPRLLPMVMDGRGIAEALLEVGTHGLEHLGQNRRCRVVVEIDALHTEPTSILRDFRVYRTDSGTDRRDLACYVAGGDSDMAKETLQATSLPLVDRHVMAWIFRA